MNIWSYSTYSSAIRCLRLYKYQYIEEAKPDYESPDLAFGKALHASLNALFNEEDGESLFETYWSLHNDKAITWGRYSWEDLSKMGKEFLRKFKKQHRWRYTLILGEVRLRAEYKNIILEGTPDFIGKFKQDSAEDIGSDSLFDFKTSSINYSADKKYTALQPNLYAFLAQQNGYKFPKLLGYQVFNKYTGTVQNPLTWKFDEAKMYTMLDSIVANVGRQPTKEPYPQNFNCCLEYNKRCPYWSKCHND